MTARSFYQRFDRDGDGSLTLSEVSKAIKDFKGIELSEREIEMLMRFWDSDKSGDVTYKEFTRGLRYMFKDPSMRTSLASRIKEQRKTLAALPKQAEVVAVVAEKEEGCFCFCFI